ncbi:MAG: carbohydrate ABC transporter permease [Caldilineaceae bacterium]|nr:carbohydrate ABC transporter permease [Caldilineaceae bacterium]MBP9073930.1 carbohydrate ABC transporter permease [Caldilineaceae bacterium]
MTNTVAVSTKTTKRFLGMAGRRRLLRGFALVVMLIYTVITLFPFYALFIRSFVSTRDSAELHLVIPKAAEVNMNAQVGNLSVFYNLDLQKLKTAFDIPQSDFIMSRTTLAELGEQYNIPEQRIRDFFKGFYTYNGWNTLLTSTLYGTSFWGALLRTLLITVISVLFGITLSIFTGYGLAGLYRRDQMLVYNIYLLQMVVPAMLILLPQFLMFQWFFKLFPGYSNAGPMRFGLQLLAIILINIKGTALSTMIFTSAISSIPKELEDSAMIDGASSWQFVRFILLPLLKVPVVSLLVIMLPLVYNQFLEPYVYLDPANSTLLPFIQSAVGQFSTNFQLIYSAIFASVLPMVIVYLLFRRMFVEGVMAGAIKG